MNFNKYEREISSFFHENFESLKLSKIGGSENAFQELLLTEQADTNNAIRNIMKKIVFAARSEFVKMTSEEEGYKLGEEYKKVMKIPQLELIKLNEESVSSALKWDETDHEKSQSSKVGYENFKHKSVIEREKKNQAAMMAGVAVAGTMTIGIPLVALTPLGLGTKFFIVGGSAIIIGGIVYTILNLQDRNGSVQKVRVSPSRSVPGDSIKTSKSTVNKVMIENLLDARKLEAELVVQKAIKHAEEEFDRLTAMINS